MFAFGEGARSLGTIRVERVQAVRYQHYPDRGRWDYRLRFRGRPRSEEFQLAVVDLDFRWLVSMPCATADSPRMAPQPRILTALQAAKRLPAHSAWREDGKNIPDRCYLQITGVLRVR